MLLVGIVRVLEVKLPVSVRRVITASTTAAISGIAGTGGLDVPVGWGGGYAGMVCSSVPSD